MTVSQIRDRTGALVGLSAVGRDIGESKRAVEALRSSEARTSAIFASALDPIITMDREGRIGDLPAIDLGAAGERSSKGGIGRILRGREALPGDGGARFGR